MTMTNTNSNPGQEPKMASVLLEDVQRGDFFEVVHRDFKELKEFMIDEDRQKRLAEMNRLQRWLHMLLWLLKSLFFRLTPARRLLLIIGLVLLLSFRYQTNINHVNINLDLTLVGGLILLFLLMLELKDKLVARKELEAGRAVQEALMPERSPKVPGWSLWLFTRSANEVGGDLVDFMRVNGNRFGLALGDVAGKGLRAALLMAKLQATLRALVPDVLSLAELGAKLNLIFSRDTIPTIFASLAYLEIQSDLGLIRVLNAGHFPPLIVKGTQVEKMDKGGAALGILHTATFAEQRVELAKGDTLLVYSDGVTEARNEQGDYYGEQRLLGLLPQLANLETGRVGEALVGEVDHFMGQARANDDLSIVLLRRE
jgi:sigma-B regulation protein RsbU (phosphoserine phosphatase)